MRLTLLRLSLFLAVVALVPAPAFAQQRPDGTSMDEAPAAGPNGAVDACGKTASDAFGEPGANGTPVQGDTLNPKDTGMQPMNLSSVTGVVVHAEGDLMLLRTRMEPATGNVSPTTQTVDRSWTVVQLPAGCGQLLSEGSQVTAVGQPMPSGILNAATVRID